MNQFTASQRKVSTGVASQSYRTIQRAADHKQGSEPTIDMPKVAAFVDSHHRKHSNTTNRNYRTEDQRIEINAKENEDLLRKVRKLKGNATYVDLTYHDTVDYIDKEFGQFSAEAEKAGLNRVEVSEAYDLYLGRQEHHHIPKGNGKGEIEATGSSPYTVMTPVLLGLYQNAHYRDVLQKPDHTTSTRDYEVKHLSRTTQLPFSQWRAFALPEAKYGQTETMLNEVGSSLDIQTPTSSDTIGQGKITSAVYKHFQRAMELLNARLDQQFATFDANSDEAFRDRTQKHLEHFEPLAGMEHNEREWAGKSPYGNWESLQPVMAKLLELLKTSIALVPNDPGTTFQSAVQVRQLQGTDMQVLKQLELLGSMIGLMMKTEKRQIINGRLLDPHYDVQPRLERLYQLHRVEQDINQQLAGGMSMRQLLATKQQKAQITKELGNL